MLFAQTKFVCQPLLVDEFSRSSFVRFVNQNLLTGTAADTSQRYICAR